MFTPASTLGGTTITCVSVSKCGNWLFRGLQNGSILVTHLRPSIQQNTSSKNSSGKPQLSHRIIQTSHIGPITCIATNTTGWIATSSEDRSIIVSPLSQFLKLDSTSVQQNSNIEIKLQGHTLPVTDMYFTSDSRLISVSRDQTLKVSFFTIILNEILESNIFLLIRYGMFSPRQNYVISVFQALLHVWQYLQQKQQLMLVRKTEIYIK